MTETPKHILERAAQLVSLRPGLSEEQIALFQSGQPGQLQPEILEVLRYSSGFDIDFGQLLRARHAEGVKPVRFTGTKAVMLEILPNAIDLATDGFGNFWLVDVHRDGVWGAVMFVSHDPPVIAIQAGEFGEFLTQLLEPEKCEVRHSLKYVHDEAVSRIWREEPWLMDAKLARSSEDNKLRSFAEQLPERFSLADLRAKEIGSGFSWGRSSADSDLRRDGDDLIFGVERKPAGILKRLFARH